MCERTTFIFAKDNVDITKSITIVPADELIRTCSRTRLFIQSKRREMKNTRIKRKEKRRKQ